MQIVLARREGAKSLLADGGKGLLPKTGTHRLSGELSIPNHTFRAVTNDEGGCGLSINRHGGPY